MPQPRRIKKVFVLRVAAFYVIYRISQVAFGNRLLLKILNVYLRRRNALTYNSTKRHVHFRRLSVLHAVAVNEEEHKLVLNYKSCH